MSQSDPRSRTLSWFAVANQALFFVVVILAISHLTQSFLMGLAGVILLMIWLRWMRSILLRPYRKGIRLIEEGKFAEAAAAFEQGHRFFERFAILDNFRVILLLSPSRMGYRELALTNLGYAYVRAGEREKAKATYERLRTEFPHSRAAKAALRQLAGDSKLPEPVPASPESDQSESNPNDQTTS